jgi:hypothetical protein
VDDSTRDDNDLGPLRYANVGSRVAAEDKAIAVTACLEHAYVRRGAEGTCGRTRRSEDESIVRQPELPQ